MFSNQLPSKICEICLKDLNVVIEFKRKFDKSTQILQNCMRTNEKNAKSLHEDNSKIEENIKIIHTIDRCLNNKMDVDNKNYGKTMDDCSDLDNISVKILKPKVKLKQKRKTKQTTVFKQSDSISTNVNKSIKKKSSNFKDERKHMCAVCGKKFILTGNLISHERIHSGDKPFQCKICKQSFAQSGHLMVHERTHSGFKPYQCDKCSKFFTVSQSLKKHYRTHTGEKPYPCTICDKRFGSSYHLSAHIKSHSCKV